MADKKQGTQGKTKAEIIEAVLDKMIAGKPYTLTSEEQKTLLELGGSGESEVGKLGLSMDEFQDMMGGAIQNASNGESFLERMERRVKRGEATEQLAAGLSLAKNLIGLTASANQISQSNRSLRALRAPTAPGLPQMDPALSQSIFQAQQATFDPARAVGAAQGTIDDQYVRDLGLARDISGGQSATYGALGQAASLRRNRAAGDLAPLIDNIRAREQARLDSLINQRQGYMQQDFNNRQNLYQTALNQYNTAQQAAGQQGMVGRENLFGTLNNLANDLSVIGGNYASKYYTGNKDIDEYDMKVNTNLSRLRATPRLNAPIPVRDPLIRGRVYNQ